MTVEVSGPSGATAPAASAGYHDRNDRTSGSITCNSVTWANLDNGLDLTLTAKAGDVVEVGYSAYMDSEAVGLGIDAVSLVAGAPVNSWADQAAPDNTHFGAMTWFGGNGVAAQKGGSIIKPLVGGDVAGGLVVIRFRYRTDTAANKTVFAIPTVPVSVWAVNHG